MDLARTAYAKAGTVGVDSSYFALREGSSLITQFNHVDEAHLPEVLSALRSTYTSTLTQRPMYAPAWPRVAMVSLLQENDPAEFIRFFEASYIMGPQDFRLRLMRVWLGLRKWDELDADLRKDVRNDVEVIWNSRLQHDLADLYFRSSFSQRVLLRSFFASEQDAERLRHITQELLDQGRL